VEGVGLGDVEGVGLGDVEGVGLGDVEGVGLGDVEGVGRFGVDWLGLAEALGLGDVEGSTGGATPGLDGRAGAECLDGLDGPRVGGAMGDVEGGRTTTRVAPGLDALGVEEPLEIATASPPSASTVAAAEVITRWFTASGLLWGCSIGLFAIRPLTW
jgi:hypothetical protein